jgi:hypothetical protein
MVFNTEQLPVAGVLVAMALGIMIFRVPLARFSDWVWARDRTPEQTRSFARLAFFTGAALILVAIVLVVFPSPDGR